jgi:hypothetical protein
MTAKQILIALLKQNLAVAVETEVAPTVSEWSVYLYDEEGQDILVDIWDSETIGEAYWESRVTK